ncbi:1-deoxy-D-xylulose 5-phosphate reductoisomerase [bioreactor metagenome]|uniref:1-deoxy-D-xylulose 5-phosphate reductoisomerase n=1 Tax=bioreactor metagenome TaxID=1076179 RepID=A0A645IQZ6_9ZZZZ
MNKGLEVIEARWLFGLQPNQLDVVIHPQSLVHALVQYCDGSLLAHMGYPDMRMPIAYALSYPERWALSLPRLSWSDLSGLRFDTPDFTRFPALTMAFEVNRMAGCMPASMSAANEVAVTAFLDGLIRFTDIIPLVQHVLEETTPRNLNSVECVIEADRLAREKANLAISRMREKR